VFTLHRFLVFLALTFIGSLYASSERIYNTGRDHYQQGCDIYHNDRLKEGERLQRAGQEFTIAVQYFRQAADQQYLPAMYALGVCYEFGRGVKQDFNVAAFYYKNAASKRHTAAQCRYALLLKKGAIDDGQTTPADLLRACAERGYYPARVAYGRLLENGDGVLKNLAAAVQCYREAAEDNNPDGLYEYGRCLEHGIVVPRDFDTAVTYFQEAARRGSADAQCRYGQCCESGIGVMRQDVELAAGYYKQAADQDDAVGQYNYGRCLEFGSGVLRDVDAAIEWYRRAAGQGYAPAVARLQQLAPQPAPPANDDLIIFEPADDDLIILE
jgi:TPR repeat protein